MEGCFNMGVFKYVFILNSETLTPENYHGSFESDSFKVNVFGVNSMDMACKTVEKAVKDGAQLIDLCGDYDEAKANEIKSLVNKDVGIKFVRYNDVEMAKFNALTSIKTYGIIIKVDGFAPEIHNLKMESDELDTTVVGVSNMKEACDQAKKMADSGIAFIELCSAFDEEKANEIVSAVNGKIPVGFAG